MQAMKAPPKKTARPGADRPVRVAAQLRQEIARLLSRDFADPRLEGVVVASAWMSNDLRLAKVFYRVASLDDAALAARRKEVEAALARASGRLRKAVTSALALRVAPELQFLYDEGQDARTRIEQLLDEVKRGV